MAICARDAVECAGDCNRGDCGDFGDEVSCEFGVGGFRRSGGGDFVEGRALGIEKLRDQRDFAGGTGGEDVQVSLRGVFKGELFCDDGAKRSIFKAR